MKSCYRCELTGESEHNGIMGWEYRVSGNDAPPLVGWLRGTKNEVMHYLVRMEAKINKRHNHEVESTFRIRKLKI